MPIATPFHPRTSARCVSLFYKDWAGYYAVRSYDTTHDREYFAFRHACGLIDVTPLYKYDVRGEDAARFLARVMVRDIRKLKVGQVYYVCWCDDHGQDHRRRHRVAPRRRRLPGDVVRTRVALAPADVARVSRHRRGRERCRRRALDSRADVARRRQRGERRRGREARVLSIDGRQDRRRRRSSCRAPATPATSATKSGCATTTPFASTTRSPRRAARTASSPRDLDAMDVTRVEAGFILNGVDYYSARSLPDPVAASRRLSSWDWAGWSTRRTGASVATRSRSRTNSARRENSSASISTGTRPRRCFAPIAFRPRCTPAAWRDARPVYDSRGAFIGQATSGAWSPLLKKNLALATLAREHTSAGHRSSFRSDRRVRASHRQSDGRRNPLLQPRTQARVSALADPATCRNTTRLSLALVTTASSRLPISQRRAVASSCWSNAPSSAAPP